MNTAISLKCAETSPLSESAISSNRTCHVCQPRGGCLSKLLLKNDSLHDQLQQAKRIYRKGEHIFREAELSEAFFVIRSGSVKTYFISADGEEQVLGFYLPGDVFGLDFNPKQARASSAVTLETSSLCRFPIAYLTEQSIGLNLLKLTSEQMIRDHNLVLMLARKDADGRIASFLTDLAHRYQARGYSGTAFNLTMSRQDIGCYLGLAVETVSRTLTRFQESGILSVNRRDVEILQPETLETLAGTQVNSIA